MDGKQEKGISLSGAFLKNIAYGSMLIDHFFAVIFVAYMEWRVLQGFSLDTANEVYHMGRAIGRIAFILFAFMAAEGFRYTHSAPGYLLRLGVFAFLSEIPFDLAIYGEVFTMEGQNVYFTLFFGVLALWILNKFKGHLLLQSVGVAFCCILAILLDTDYMFMGVLLIVVFYLFRSSFWYQFLAGAVTIYVGIVLVYVISYWGAGIHMTTFLKAGMSELYGLFAFVFLYFYNGEKGRQLPKACYYLFYPLHLLLLYGIKQQFFG